MSRELATQPADDSAAPQPPGWARALDEGGRRFWRKPTAEGRARSRRVGYVVSILVNALLIAVARSIPTWGLSFITADFDAVLPAIQLSLTAAIVANAILFAYDEPWFRHLSQAVVNAFSLNATLVLRRVFPFDFGGERGDGLARLMIALVLIAVIIAIVAEAVQLALALAGAERETEG